MKSNRLMLFLTATLLCAVIVLAHAATVAAARSVEAPPLAQQIRVRPGPVKSTSPMTVPLITWGGDMATILANGNAKVTAPGSIFAEKGLRLKLVRRDDFRTQVEAYLRGDTPFLRGTMGMINMAAEVLSQDPGTRPVIVYQMTWSGGGDCLVVKSNIQTARDLKGKTIAVQAYGPHVDYMTKILKDAGLGMQDVVIKWMPDLTGTDDTPAEALFDDHVDAAFVIIPDGLMLTSNGTVGTGAEGSVRGARILLSTKTANRIIADVYAVRSDFFQTHRQEVEAFVHGLMLGEQALRSLYKNRQHDLGPYQKTLTAAAEILLDSDQATADAQALYLDCEFVGFPGNVKFFGDAKWPRNMTRLTAEIQSTFVSMGLLPQTLPLDQARWDYDRLRTGLTGIDAVDAPRFDKAAVAQVVAKKQALGTLDDGELFSFEINFQPNQKVFSESLYASQFTRVVEMAATYGGAVITVEGHSDPHKYNRLKKQGVGEVRLKRTGQAAKNLSMSRAIAVRDSVVRFARDEAVPIDDSQFTVIGHGIDQPKFPRPKTKEQWLRNMRVVFRIIQIEAEADAFIPLE